MLLSGLPRTVTTMRFALVFAICVLVQCAPVTAAIAIPSAAEISFMTSVRLATALYQPIDTIADCNDRKACSSNGTGSAQKLLWVRWPHGERRYSGHNH
jgi:hypothetical protein